MHGSLLYVLQYASVDSRLSSNFSLWLNPNVQTLESALKDFGLTHESEYLISTSDFALAGFIFTLKSESLYLSVPPSLISYETKGVPSLSHCPPRILYTHPTLDLQPKQNLPQCKLEGSRLQLEALQPEKRRGDRQDS